MAVCGFKDSYEGTGKYKKVRADWKLLQTAENGSLFSFKES